MLLSAAILLEGKSPAAVINSNLTGKAEGVTAALNEYVPVLPVMAVPINVLAALYAFTITPYSPGSTGFDDCLTPSLLISRNTVPETWAEEFTVFVKRQSVAKIRM